MSVKFSELAQAGLVKHFPDDSRRKSVVAVLQYYIGRGADGEVVGVDDQD